MLLFLLTLFTFHGGNVEAAIPPPSSLSNTREVRILLGTFKRFSLTGVDLQLNVQQFEGDSAFQIRCRSAANSSYIEFGAGTSVGHLDIFSPTGFLRINGKLYRNRIRVVASGNECLVINTLSLEKYLAGLITKEMAPSWPLEALKAQAVASRSYAIYQAGQNKRRAFDMESTTQDQVYDGAASETARSTQAVEETAGMVLFSGSSPLKAYFHANCGGMTETPDSVWGTDAGKFLPVVCPYHHRKETKKRWTVHVTKTQLKRALSKISGFLPSFFRLAKLEAGAPNPNQRLNDVVVSDVQGNSLLLPANAFRNALGNTKVKSTAFHIEKEGEGYKIVGTGFGHGVGMCQIGARAMAQEGKSYRDILRLYYPLAKIVRAR